MNRIWASLSYLGSDSSELGFDPGLWALLGTTTLFSQVTLAWVAVFMSAHVVIALFDYEDQQFRRLVYSDALYNDNSNKAA